MGKKWMEHISGGIANFTIPDIDWKWMWEGQCDTTELKLFTVRNDLTNTCKLFIPIEDDNADDNVEYSMFVPENSTDIVAQINNETHQFWKNVNIVSNDILVENTDKWLSFLLMWDAHKSLTIFSFKSQEEITLSQIVHWKTTEVIETIQRPKGSGITWKKHYNIPPVSKNKYVITNREIEKQSTYIILLKNVNSKENPDKKAIAEIETYVKKLSNTINNLAWALLEKSGTDQKDNIQRKLLFLKQHAANIADLSKNTSEETKKILKSFQQYKEEFDV